MPGSAQKKNWAMTQQSKNLKLNKPCSTPNGGVGISLPFCSKKSYFFVWIFSTRGNPAQIFLPFLGRFSLYKAAVQFFITATNKIWVKFIIRPQITISRFSWWLWQISISRKADRGQHHATLLLVTFFLWFDHKKIGRCFRLPSLILSFRDDYN